MCCFSAPTHVSGTRIFARLTRPNAQLLVYQMQYSAEAPTAMILPLPVALPAREGSVRWRSLKENPGFFDHLEAGFQVITRSAPRNAANHLEVHEVGDFIASFVPTQEDFERLDPRFSIKKDVWRKVPEYRDYGFAVFQLKELSGSPHPMAFEFDTRLPGALFFPTVHIHDGSVHSEDTFDHVLYLQDARFDARAGSFEGPRHQDPHTGFVRSRDVARALSGDEGGILEGSLLVHRTEMKGVHPNIDTLIPIEATPESGGKPPEAAAPGCGRCDAGSANGTGGAFGALPVGLAGLAWLLRRRDVVRGQ